MFSSLKTNSPAPAEKLLHYSNAVIFLVTLFSYFALVQISNQFFNPATHAGTFSPGAGFILGLLLVLPSRQWLWVIAAVAIGETVTNQLHTYPIVANIFWTSSNCVEPLLGAALIRRSGNTAGTLAPQSNMFRFIAYAVVVAPIIGATIGSIGTLQVFGTPILSTWPKWFIGDSLGVLVVAPLILTRFQVNNPLLWSREKIVFAMLLLITGTLVLRNWSNFLDIVLPYLFLPFALWAALRFGLQGTVLTIFFIATAATLSINFGYVPFQAPLFNEVQGVTMMQVRLLIVSSTALVVAALTHDLIQGLRNEKRLMRQAHRDELTGLYNRAGLSFRVENSSQRRQADKPLHLLICDMDAFKPINDKYGHLAGDEVLIEVAARLSACIRDGDAAARIGGDEFVVLLDNSDSHSVAFIAGRIIEQMAKPVRGSFGTAELSMSIGITQWDNDTDIETAMRAADKALYKAKNEGKNRFVWAPTSA
tara:strand:+ start:2265 stop:3701 length:1437 start_codon:yes stop_codon:yes gene_type:complete